MNAPAAALAAEQAGLAITLRHVGKQFGPRAVLSGVSLDVEPGTFLAVIGRSGSGKSTLLRLLAGLERPDQGEVSLGGRAVRARADAIRIMFQDGRLLPWRSVLDNVALGAPTGARRRAEAALARVGLADRARDWPRTLSGGQRQRVALARALTANPGLLLLDEPLGALDALTRLDMQRLIEDIWSRSRFTAVLVTHDVAEAILLGDRIVLIEDGRIGLDITVDLPRPREPGAAFSRIERDIYRRLGVH